MYLVDPNTLVFKTYKLLLYFHNPFYHQSNCLLSIELTCIITHCLKPLARIVHLWRFHKSRDYKDRHLTVDPEPSLLRINPLSTLVFSDYYSCHSTLFLNTSTPNASCLRRCTFLPFRYAVPECRLPEPLVWSPSHLTG